MYVPGTSRNKKYLNLLVLVLFASLAGIACVAVNSGILAEENLEIPRHLLTRINSERLSHNLPPVKTDPNLTDLAVRMSQDARVSPGSYTSPAVQKSTGITDVFIYPKLSWAVASISLEPPLFDALVAEDTAFQQNLLNKGYNKVGIGISSDSYNYYIVTKWQ
ncbi:MAG: hypothetical protein Q7T80_12280 [Methanoregula sp.]|nr:hypothetical protein [Methanoregula sp.]